MAQVFVRDLMTREVVTLSEEESMIFAEDTMRLARVRHLPVVRGRELVGLVTHRDLLRAAVKGRGDPRGVRISELMQREVATIGPDEPASRALRKLLDAKFGCLPVLGEARTLVGIVTEADFARWAMRSIDGPSPSPDPTLGLGDPRRSAAATPAQVARFMREHADLPEQERYQRLADHLSLGTVSLAQALSRAQRGLLDKLSPHYLLHHRLIPLELEGETLCVAGPDPSQPIEDLSAALGAKRASMLLMTASDFTRALHELRPPPERIASADLPRPEPAVAGAPGFVLRPARGHGRIREMLRKIGELTAAPKEVVEAHYRQVLDALLVEAVLRRATDLHFEQYGEHVRLRLRIDGALIDEEGHPLEPADFRALVNVIKVRSELDLAEHRRPQGGRIHTKIDGEVFDIRVQIQPSLWGEHAVLRFLPRATRLMGIDELGFPAPIAAAYRRLLERPSGLVLVVGPTSSGKSTTLYAALDEAVRDRSKKIISAEDPIEYSVDGVQQVEIQPELGLSFAQATRSFVRQDPNLILIGEIRDYETAIETVRASETGHLVLSTLHANDAVDAVQRLLDLGIHPNSLVSELAAVFAQRLARRVCSGCSRPHQPIEPELLERVFGAHPPQELQVARGAGCDRCQGLGTYGRIAMVEHLASSQELRRAIAERRPLHELRRVAQGGALTPMLRSAMSLVRAGIIPLAELPRVLLPEQLGLEPA